MSLRVVPFLAASGFSDQQVPGTQFYSQGLVPSRMDVATQYSMLLKASSASIPGLGSIQHQTTRNGILYVQDDSGQIWKEATRGQYDFTLVRSPGGTGAGLLADQYGNLY